MVCCGRLVTENTPSPLSSLLPVKTMSSAIMSSILWTIWCPSCLVSLNSFAISCPIVFCVCPMKI